LLADDSVAGRRPTQRAISTSRCANFGRESASRAEGLTAEPV